MKTPCLLFISAVIIALGTPAAAEVALPNGPNRDLVARTCSACHDLGLVIATGGRSRADWNGTIDDMVQYGLSISPEERATVLDYLSTYLPFRQ
jgi:cytochrome c5